MALKITTLVNRWIFFKGLSIYYVSIILDFFWPTHLVGGWVPLCRDFLIVPALCQHRYSTERQQNWPFSRPTHPVLYWRNIWMVPKPDVKSSSSVWSKTCYTLVGPFLRVTNSIYRPTKSPLWNLYLESAFCPSS